MSDASPHTTLLPINGGRRGGAKSPKSIVAHATILDDRVAAVLKQLPWHLNSRGYAQTKYCFPSGRERNFHLHAIIYHHYHGQLPPGHEVDHEDRNKLNCLPSNLRAVTHSVNAANCSRRVDNTSGYKGVSWHKQKRKWEAQIQVNLKKMHLGYFTRILPAARAVNAAYRKFFPEVAIPNPEAEAA